MSANKRRLSLLGWSFILGALTNYCVAGEIGPGPPRVLKPGLTAYAFDISGNDDASGQIIFIESGKSDYAPRLIGGADQIGSFSFEFPTTLGELISNDVPVLISGAYGQRTGGTLLPLGYLKSANQEISARPHHSWLVDTVICTDPHKSESAIFSVEALDQDMIKGFSDCAQTGPRLFQNGKNVVEVPEADDESGRQHYVETSRIQLFVCKGDDNPASPLGIGITTEKITLLILDKILPKLKIGNRKVCRNVTALSGSISAGMLINGKLVAGSATYLLTSAVAFVRRSGSPSRKSSLR